MTSNKKRKVARMYEYGAPNVIQLEDQPIPTPRRGEVLVRMELASVNFLDIQKRRGDLVNQKFYQIAALQKKDLPADLGSQGVGVVEDIGPAVTGVTIGQRVVCAGGSTYASYITFPAQRLIPIPDSIRMEDAAAGFLQGFLAWAFTNKAYPVQPNDWCLVQAAAGGLGLLICQMIKLRGGKVIGVTSTEEKAKCVRENGGADEVIISSQTDIAEAVKRITEEKGVNVVYDGVGKDTFEANLDALTPGGYFIMFGQASGYVPPFDLMKLQEKGSIFLTRTNGLPYMKHWPEYQHDFVKWMENKELKLKIDHIYPLSEVAEAHEAVEKRKTSGRVLLRM